MTKQELKKQMLEDNTIEQLEEVGYIDIDDVTVNIRMFIQTLEEITGKEYELVEKVGKLVIQEI